MNTRGEGERDAVPLGGALLEGVEDLSVVAQLADEALLPAQTAAEDVRAGKLDHLGQEGSQFSVNHLQGTKMFFKKSRRSERTAHK